MDLLNPTGWRVSRRREELGSEHRKAQVSQPSGEAQSKLTRRAGGDGLRVEGGTLSEKGEEKRSTSLVKSKA